MRKSVADRLRFSVTKGQVVPRPAGQLLLPRCYQNTPYQEHPGAPSLNSNHRILGGIGRLRYAQVVPGENYEWGVMAVALW